MSTKVLVLARKNKYRVSLIAFIAPYLLKHLESKSGTTASYKTYCIEPARRAVTICFKVCLLTRVK